MPAALTFTAGTVGPVDAPYHRSSMISVSWGARSCRRTASKTRLSRKRENIPRKSGAHPHRRTHEPRSRFLPVPFRGRRVAAGSSRNPRPAEGRHYCGGDPSPAAATKELETPFSQICSGATPPRLAASAALNTARSQGSASSRTRPSAKCPNFKPCAPDSARTRFLRSVVFGTTRAQAVGWLPQATDRRRNSVGLGVIGILQARKCCIGQD